MIIGKVFNDLTEALYVALEEYNIDREVMDEVESKLMDRNIYEARSILNASVALESLQPEIVYLLSQFLYEATQNEKINPACYFTEVEIDSLKNYKKKPKDTIKLPLVFEIYKPHAILISGIVNCPSPELFDYIVRKPFAPDELVYIVSRVVKTINKKKENITKHTIINQLLIDINATGKDKFLLEKILTSLMNDSDLPEKGGMYDWMGKILDKDPSTIKRNIAAVIDHTYKPPLWQKVLGLEKKPKNKELIDRMLEKINEEYKRGR